MFQQGSQAEPDKECPYADTDARSEVWKSGKSDDGGHVMELYHALVTNW